MDSFFNVPLPEALEPPPLPWVGLWDPRSLGLGGALWYHGACLVVSEFWGSRQENHAFGGERFPKLTTRNP